MHSLFADLMQNAMVPLDPDELVLMPDLVQYSYVLFDDVAVSCYRHNCEPGDEHRAPNGHRFLTVRRQGAARFAERPQARCHSAKIIPTSIYSEVHMELASGVVRLYLDRDYQGASASLEEGTYDIHHLRGGNVGNDAISSLRVADGYQVTAYKDAGLQGSSTVFTADTPWVGADFDDAISSLKITKHGGAAPTPRMAGAGSNPVPVSLGTMDLTATVWR